MLFSTERAHNKCFSHSDSIIISSLHKYLSASSAMSFVLSISGLRASCMPAITRALDFLLSVGFYSHISVILPKKQNRKFWGSWSVCLTMRPQRVLGTSLNFPVVGQGATFSWPLSLLSFLTWQLIVYHPLTSFTMWSCTLLFYENLTFAEPYYVLAEPVNGLAQGTEDYYLGLKHLVLNHCLVCAPIESVTKSKQKQKN